MWWILAFSVEDVYISVVGEHRLKNIRNVVRNIRLKKTFPKKNDKKGKDKVRFTNIAKQLPLPFYFVADFECILKKNEEQEEQQEVAQNEKCCCGKEKPTVK